MISWMRSFSSFRCLCLCLFVTISLFLCHDASAISISKHKLQHRLQSVLSATDGDGHDADASHTLQPPLKGIKPLENPKGATIVGGAGVKIGVKPEIVLKAVDEKEFVEPTFVEIDGETEMDAEMDAETAHPPPAMFLPPNAAPASALHARIAIRGGVADTNPLAAANGGTFTYVLDGFGRVTQAWGFVVLKKRTTLAQAVHQYCDTLWYFSPSKFAGGVATNRVNMQWHSGHVIASALGGSDVDPINFFPQHAKSNSGGGIWWRVEMIVGAAKAVLATLNPACQIMIRPTLDYTPLPNDWMPDRGIYYVEIDYGCASLYAGIGKPSGLAGVFHNWVTDSVGSNMGAGDDPAFSFVNNVFGIVAPGYRYSIAWLNTANKANTLNAANLFN